jgi:hypothetical protein
VEFGPYFSQQPVRQYVGHTEDILDMSWSAGARNMLFKAVSVSLHVSGRLHALLATP